MGPMEFARKIEDNFSNEKFSTKVMMLVAAQEIDVKEAMNTMTTVIDMVNNK